ncbi:MAG: polysaccharide pyruvyl transferase family protein [Clostridia bacterium]|nr:polysaccharide pyruvyl transferase family protein [Clostridia bacterium]
MKCGVITFHRAINYGGVLQAYALQQAIGKLGAETEVIDYYCEPIESMYRPKLRDIFKINNQKRFISAILKNGILKFNNSGFEKFREKYLKVSSKKYYSKAELEKAEYDAYITGSDQVWSYYCAGFDKAYFLDFVKDSKKKNAYAASFGVGSIPENLNDEYYSLLNDFNFISVRESDGAKIIDSIMHKEVPVVPDPTMLLNKEEWSRLLPEKKAADGKYILIYMIAEDDELVSEAIKWSRKCNMKVCYINDRLYKKKGVTNLRKVSPEQWVDLFMDAEYVFTNSFHGVAFSINFGKPLYVRGLKSNTKVNSRISNILEKYSITSCMTETSPQPTNLDAVAAKTEEDRRCGMEALKQILMG